MLYGTKNESSHEIQHLIHLQSKMITVYGGVKLTGRERQYLMLGPDFTIPERMEKRQFKKDFQTTLTKVRWGRMDLDPEEVVRVKTKEQE